PPEKRFPLPMTPRPPAALGAVLSWLLLAAAAAPSPAGVAYPGFMPMITDSAAVFTVPSLPEPGYLHAILDPTFGTLVTRIADDPGQPVGTLESTWGIDARHVYSKVEPWNSTGTMLALDGGGPGSSRVLLDGSSYQPVLTPCPNYDFWDARWHPKLQHAREQINVNRTGTELMWFDVENCVKRRSWPLPVVADYGIGSGEGNVSTSGRFVVIANQRQMLVVDMAPLPPNAPPYPYRRYGPIYTFEPCSLDVAQPAAGSIGN